MPPPSRTASQKQQDLAIVAKQRCQQKTFAQIAQYINEHFPHTKVYTEEMAKKDWQACVKLNADARIRDTDEAITVELMWRDNMEAVLWDDYNASKGVQTKKHTSMVVIESGKFDADGNPIGARTQKQSNLTETQMSADPRLAHLILVNRKERTGLLGLNDPDTVVNVGVGVKIAEKAEFGPREEEEAYRIFMELEEQRNAHLAPQLVESNGTKPDLNW